MRLRRARLECTLCKDAKFSLLLTQKLLRFSLSFYPDTAAGEMVLEALYVLLARLLIGVYREL